MIYDFQIPEAVSEQSVATASAARAAEDLHRDRDGASPNLDERLPATVALNVKTRSRVRSDAEFTNNKRVSFSETVKIREYLVEEACNDEDTGLAAGIGSAAEPAAAAGRKRGRPPQSEEQKREKEVTAAESQAEAAFKACLERHKELREGCDLWQEPSVVARVKERYERQWDRMVELQKTACLKRHYFEEWCIAMKEAAMTKRIHSLQDDMAQMELQHACELELSAWYEMRECRRRAMAAEVARAEAEAEEARVLREKISIMRRMIVLQKRLGAEQRLCLAWYDPRCQRLWLCGGL